MAIASQRAGAGGWDVTEVYPVPGGITLTNPQHNYDAPPLGTHQTDLSGNEFVLVDFGVNVPANGWQQGEFCTFILTTYAAARMTASGRGFVGVVMSANITSTLRYGWVQVYGVNTFAWANTSVTTAMGLTVPVTTDLGTIGASASTDVSVALFGCLAVTDPNSCASTALGTSALAAPCTVILNYPFITGQFWVGS